MSDTVRCDEEWRPVPGFPGYEVSSCGNVKSLKRRNARILKPFTTPDGYKRISLCLNGKRRSILAHQLVLLGFVGPKPLGLEARHLNGIPSDNRVENLVWGTHDQNYRDKIAHGTDHRGERNVFAKLNRAAVLEIRQSQLSCVKAGLKFGVSQATVHNIRKGKKWAWLSSEA